MFREIRTREKNLTCTMVEKETKKVTLTEEQEKRFDECKSFWEDLFTTMGEN